MAMVRMDASPVGIDRGFDVMECGIVRVLFLKCRAVLTGTIGLRVAPNVVNKIFGVFQTQAKIPAHNFDSGNQFAATK